MSVCTPIRRTFSDERSHGTFQSLGPLPKRSSARKSPVFHIPHDDDDHSSSHDEHSPQPPPATIRFPSSEPSPFDSNPPSPTSPPGSPRPQLARGASVPVLLSNGKPLKSSLKSSSSSPAMMIPTQSQNTHLRARSEPSTPKNVHFPEKDYALATVRVFKRSARPAALSNPANGNGDETETEGEDTPTARFPFPSLSPTCNYEIDPTKSSSVPSKSSPANLLLESLNLSPSSFSSSSPTKKPLLTGSVLVRNLAFEKHVAIRFTLDEWQTVSEVGAHYVDSPRVLPSQIPSPPPSAVGNANGRGWDRFTFTIRLEDYAHTLSTRTLWLAARYHVHSTYPEPGSSLHGPGGEWWDNNDGRNYRLGFRPTVTASASPRSRPRRETVPAPISSPPPARPQPPVAFKGHALGLMVPSVPNREDRHLPPLRTGKLTLCNYVPPTVRTPSSISFPSDSPQTSSPPSITKPALPPHSSSDDDTASPASSTLSTPTVSPTIVPRVIIGGHPATANYCASENEHEDSQFSKPGHIANWDWSSPAGNAPRIEGAPHRRADLVPVSEPPERELSPLGRRPFPRGNSLYDAFVTQWCFAQEPSPNHAYDGGGIMT